MRQTEIQATAKAFNECMSIHGFALQHRLGTLFAANKNSRWSLESLEHPVEHRGHETKIDLVLRNSSDKTLLVVEVKKVKAGTKWILSSFSESESTRSRTLTFPSVESGIGMANARRLHYCHPNDNKSVFDFGISILGGNPRDIEDALGQASLGANGLASQFAANHSNPTSHSHSEPWLLIPTVITNATLHGINEHDMSTDIASGQVQAPETAFSSLNFGFVQYSVSRSRSLFTDIASHPTKLGVFRRAKLRSTCLILQSSAVIESIESISFYQLRHDIKEDHV